MSRIKVSCVKRLWRNSEFFYLQESIRVYKPEDLKNLTIKPRINDIDLDVLQRYYELFLNPFIYEYNVEDQRRNINVSLSIPVIHK